jgi:hypothetical protein
MKFVGNHEPVYKLLRDHKDSVNLFQAADTRFGSKVYAAEIILRDRGAFQAIFTSDAMNDFLNKPSSKKKSREEGMSSFCSTTKLSSLSYLQHQESEFHHA